MRTLAGLLRRVLLAGGGVWVCLGCIAALGLAGLFDNASLYPLALPPILLRLPERSLITDSAHGPPFLTPSGVILFYFVPGGLLLGLSRLARLASRRGPRLRPGEGGDSEE